MSDEVVRLISAKPVTSGRVFPYWLGSGADTELYGVEASVGADATWRYRFHVVDAGTTGTWTLRLTAIANATSGDAKVNVKWKAVARAGVDWDAEALSAEGTSTLTWAAGDANDGKTLDVTLDAATVPTDDQVMLIDVVFETTSWTLAAISGWDVQLIRV